MSLLPFFQWCEQTGVGTIVRDSTWMFPLLEVFHVLALGLLCGSILIVDLRVLGVRLPGSTVRRVSQDASPVLTWSLIVILVSGVLLFMSEAVKCYDNAAFWIKVWLLAAALLFTFTIRRRALATFDESAVGTSRFVAAVSTLLWFGVGIAGRGIGFY